MVDDAAQGLGFGRPRLNDDIAALSFYPTKVLGGLGDSGMVITSNAEKERAVRKLSNHGFSKEQDFKKILGHTGYNSRMDALQAAGLLVSLTFLEKAIEKRRGIAERYDEAFGRFAMPRDVDSAVPVYNIQHHDRDALQDGLADDGIGTKVYYRYTLNQVSCLTKSDAPNAERFSRELLALPCHEGLSEQQILYVIEKVRNRL